MMKNIKKKRKEKNSDEISFQSILIIVFKSPTQRKILRSNIPVFHTSRDIIHVRVSDFVVR